MKNEVARTGLYALAALALTAVAIQYEPESRSAEIFSDQGQTFFANFRDVADVKAIEVVDYDEAEAVAKPLKVEFRKGRWVLTSHSDYPAEARARLSSAATAFLDLKKEAAVSDRWEDHANYGVIDPLDAKNTSLSGRGKRVTLKDAGGVTLAGLVLGKPVKDKAGYRYVRLPGEKRTYSVKIEADPSAKFEDWVESDLLRLNVPDIARMVLNSYSIDEQFGRLANLQRTVMVPEKENWDAKAKTMAATLASLRVVGAYPKPPVLAQQLKARQLQMTLDVVMSLRQRGFFITPFGQLLANEGELSVETTKGLAYTLRFGEVVSDSTSAKPSENRNVFITAGTRNPAVEEQARALDAKFSDWYYVISGADFAKLHPHRTARPAAQQPQLPPGFPPIPQQSQMPPGQQLPPAGGPTGEAPGGPRPQGPAPPPPAAPPAARQQ